MTEPSWEIWLSRGLAKLRLSQDRAVVRVSSLKPTVLQNPAVSVVRSRKRLIPSGLSWNHQGGPSFSAG